MEKELNYEKQFIKGNYDVLREIDLKTLMTGKTINSESLVSLYYLIWSYENSGFINTACKILDKFETSINKFDITNDNISILIFIILKVSLLNKKGDFTEAKQYLPIFGEYIEDLAIENELLIHKFIAIYYFTFGQTYHLSGNYSQALNFYQKALTIVNNNERLFQISADIYNQIGEIFFMKGEYLYANNYYQIALTLSEEICNNHNKIKVLLNILELNLYLENFDESKNLLETIFTIKHLITDPIVLYKLLFINYQYDLTFNSQNLSTLENNFNSFKKNIQSIPCEDYTILNMVLNIGYAMYLNKKNKVTDILKAKVILENMLSEKSLINHKFKIAVIKLLCEIYLKEIKYLKKVNSYSNFQKLINELLQIAKINHFHPLFIETLLIQAREEILFDENNNLLKIETYLTLANIISQEKNLKMLSSKVLSEEKNFKDQITRWKALLPTNYDVVNLTSLEQDKNFHELKKMLLIQKPVL